jgi:hypothetical protein
MFQSLQNLIPKTAARYGIAKEMKAAELCHNFRKLIPELFSNNESPNNISPAHLKESTLTINVTSPAWAQEVIIRKPKIIEAMNKKAGKEVIKNLRTQLLNKQKEWEN